jgi:hypothetical protein
MNVCFVGDFPSHDIRRIEWGFVDLSQFRQWIQQAGIGEEDRQGSAGTTRAE